MNKDLHKITEGAIIIAINDALMFLDRQFANMFSTLLMMVEAISILIYIIRNGNKYISGLIIGILFLSFLFGDIYSNVYAPLGIVEGIIVSRIYTKKADRRKVMIEAILIAVVYEIIAAFIIFPIMGYPVMDELMAVKESTMQMMNDTGIKFSEAMLNSSTLIILYILSTILVGVMESIMVYMLSIIFLRRMKYEVPPIKPIYMYEFPTILSYLAIFAIMAMPYVYQLGIKYPDNIFISILMVLSVIGVFYLSYLGYIFSVSYGIIVLKKRVTFIIVALIVFLFPLSLLVLTVVGFLYGSGPLKMYLKNKMNYD
ncbi:MAG: DUF2232 domain-containing protein [Erysipelotrichaceae bacterium]|nr:DUF2232 domain-containing protein [Erysipelotrichaceae bacterium]